jgi:hypothetical protein
MNNTTCFRNRQQGAVAIIVGLSLFILIGLLGLVLDLGHLYITKTELQNAADAAALSGAKELNGTAAGITSAVNKAIATAGQNKFDFTHPVVIDIGDISAGSCPEDSCMVPASSVTTNTLAAGKTFLKVMIASGDLRTWFIRAIPSGPQNTSTFGLAVAGKYEVDITPIAICALLPIDATNPNQAQLAADLGYERGVSYNISNFNPIGPGTLYWIDPQSATPGVCTTTSTSDTLPYICSGKTAFTPVPGLSSVNTNTGVSNPQVAALDSRFDVYSSQNKCDPSTAPPDTNIKEYIYSDKTAGSPSQWMNPDPVQQTISCADSKCKTGKPLPYTSRSFADYGVLWSAYRPTGATVSQWPALYHGNATTYPETSPYAQTSGNFFRAPTNPGRTGRRVLNMVIVNCTTLGGNCRKADVLGIGKFFMQRKTNGPKEIDVEFGGLLPTPLPTSDIKLYR